MSNLHVWGFSIAYDLLSQSEQDYLASLPNKLPTVEWVWAEMDRVWQKKEIDNKLPLKGQAIDEFYGHPVWLMNGVFTALDHVSVLHRNAIAMYLKNIQVKSIADYGGGFGELSLAINKVMPNAEITIIEPYPSKIGLQRLHGISSTKIVTELETDCYGAVIAQDVLEHVEDPIGLAYRMASATRKNGFVLFANCFYPVMKCHLPATFHLRLTFVWIMKALGLRYVGFVPNATHTLVFERVGELDQAKARLVESISRFIGPALNFIQYGLRRIKKMVFKA